MIFSGFQKLTLLDYPGKVACILFTGGCNFRCPFCHNASLVKGIGEEISGEYVLEYLRKRQGILDGVCITGGEPLLHRELKDFLIQVKELGYAVKLDTNGSFPDYLRELVSEGLADYVAMDIKSSPAGYSSASGTSPDFKAIEQSIAFLLEGTVDYEFRTTLVKELHSEAHMEDIGKLIAGAKRYYLQNYVDSPDILGGRFTSLTSGEMEAMKAIASVYVPDTFIRGGQED